MVCSYQSISPSSSSSNLTAGTPTTDTVKLGHEVDVKLWTPEQEANLAQSKPLFTDTTRAFIWGMQPRACQVQTLNPCELYYIYVLTPGYAGL